MGERVGKVAEEKCLEEGKSRGMWHGKDKTKDGVTGLTIYFTG